MPDEPLVYAYTSEAGDELELRAPLDAPGYRLRVDSPGERAVSVILPLPILLAVGTAAEQWELAITHDEPPDPTEPVAPPPDEPEPEPG